MSRTEYVASKPTSELPFPRTRLLGTFVARQSYAARIAPAPAHDGALHLGTRRRIPTTTGPRHHLAQEAAHCDGPHAIGGTRAARPLDHDPLGTPALGRGHEPPAPEAHRARATL